MALPDYFTHEFGTSVVWGQPTASGVTANLSLNNLTNGAGRMGVSVDLGPAWYQWLTLQVLMETGTAPAVGGVVEVFLAWSVNNTTWPGKVTGADAAYPTVVVDNKAQLGLPSSVLVATADANTVLVQNAVRILAHARYVAPVVVNLWSQSLRNEATATNNDSRVILTPYRSLIQDTA